MSKKTNIEGYAVVVFVPVRDASDHWHQPAITPEDAHAMAKDIRESIARHLSHDFEFAQFRNIDIDVQSQAVCEHCGYTWTEKSAAYNGGCCDEDEKHNPDPQAQAIREKDEREEARDNGQFGAGA